MCAYNICWEGQVGENNVSVDPTVAKLLLKSTKEPRDKLPYTDEFERLHRAYCSKAGSVGKHELMREFFNLAKKGGFAGRTSEREAPDLTIEQAVFIGRRLGQRLPARASLVYTEELQKLRDDFSGKFGVAVSMADFWLAVDGLAKKAKGDEWVSQLRKAREAACLAVEVYNKPLVTFRSYGYIVLMNIAWTALMHAVFFRWGIRPFYREKDRSDRFAKIDGDYKGWELGTCLDEYFGDEASPIRENLKMFIGLRNKIEHRSLPELDHSVFGECQAMLLNFEDMLFQQFGPEHALSESLSLALQFSHLRDSGQTAAIRSLHAPLSPDIAEYIDSFRSSLSDEIRNDLAFSYRVFIIPQLANHEGSADVAVSFVKYDATNPEQMEKYRNVAAMLKPQVTQVANQGRLKASDVCRVVEPIVQQIYGPKAKFGPSYHHAAACRFYEIRPCKGSGDPTKTKTQYCHYDEAHKDYVYTDAWKSHLMQEMRKPGQYQKITEALRK
jgi:hypothetical protein